MNAPRLASKASRIDRATVEVCHIFDAVSNTINPRNETYAQAIQLVDTQEDRKVRAISLLQVKCQSLILLDDRFTCSNHLQLVSCCLLALLPLQTRHQPQSTWGLVRCGVTLSAKFRNRKCFNH